ncbi:MAG TPA: hypothetical protein PKC28_08100 [Bdellovibrionales bacterium]|nr:hypothetical protein [Bdellovibrionales bacterium]
MRAKATLLLSLCLSTPAWAGSSIPWRQAVAKYLQAPQDELATYIFRDAIWDYESRSGPDANPGPRLRQGNKTGLAELQRVVERATLGDASAERLLDTLFQLADSQRRLKDFQRDGPSWGDVIVAPDGYAQNIALRMALAQAFRDSKLNPRVLQERLAEKVLKNIDNSTLAHNVTGVLAHPELWRSESSYLRGYFLLLSVHPDPRVRISGLFGLGAWSATDSFVRRTLIEESLLHPDPYFKKEWLERAAKVFDEVEKTRELKSLARKWRAKLTPMYQHWLDNPMLSRVRDRGDYNWERMANAAAGQALLWPHAELEREIVLDSGTEKEIMERHTSLPRLDGFGSNNGTGVFFNSLIRYQTGSIILTSNMVVSTEPENAWILKGMDSGGLWRILDHMAQPGIEAHFGHGQSILSLLRFKWLKQEPPDYYPRMIEEFKIKLARNYEAYIKEFTSAFPGMRLVSMDKIGDVFSEPEDPARSKIVRMPKPGARKLKVNLFTAPLGTLFATRGLIAYDFKEEARAEILKLLPQTWVLSPLDRIALGLSLDRDIKEAGLTERSKRELLKWHFQSLSLAVGETQARRDWIKWLSGVSDEKLSEEAWWVVTPKDCTTILADE